MDSLEHEDLLIKLRAKLNEEKVKLWESPYVTENGEISQSLKDLASKYSATLNVNNDTVLQGLHELQIHSIERLKANEEFKETGCATLRVRATLPGEKARALKILKQLTISGDVLISSVAELLEIDKNRIKLIYNGKLINATTSLEDQGVKNGAQLMALVMVESAEQAKKEDKIYKEMKSTLDDATLLTECADDCTDDEEYMKLEDQSGQAVELPPAERRALMVGLALHERGRAAARNREYSLALVLLLEADRQLNECRSSILSSVDNCAVLQLDIAWCYLCLQSLSSANDAAARLTRAEKSFVATYGEDHQRLIALKGTNANERVLFMRLYLLQGVVAFHQNRREEARRLLEKAEAELNYLKVDESSVVALMELGWSEAQARTGLRAAAGDLDRAHHLLEERRRQREQAREKHKLDREQRLLGRCADGSAASAQGLRALRGMGFERHLALLALRHANNDVTEAVRLIQEHPEVLTDDMDVSDSDANVVSSSDSLSEPDNAVVAELEALGYTAERVRAALRRTRGHAAAAAQLLAAGAALCDTSNPSTSDSSSRKKLKKEAKQRRKNREMALRRLKDTIRADEEDYLSGSLADEEQFLAQYKSLV